LIYSHRTWHRVILPIFNADRGDNTPKSGDVQTSVQRSNSNIDEQRLVSIQVVEQTPDAKVGSCALPLDSSFFGKIKLN
jgi:hypothetical protein